MHEVVEKAATDDSARLHVVAKCAIRLLDFVKIPLSNKLRRMALLVRHLLARIEVGSGAVPEIVPALIVGVSLGRMRAHSACDLLLLLMAGSRSAQNLLLLMMTEALRILAMTLILPTFYHRGGRNSICLHRYVSRLLLACSYVVRDSRIKNVRCGEPKASGWRV
jgi:hypothetical protein